MSVPAESGPRKARPEFRNINVFTDLTGYRLPLPGILSILHRVSGAAMFLMLPFLMLLLDKSLTSEISFQDFMAVINFKLFGVIPVVKLVLLGLLWSFLHHMFSGIRFLLLDMHVGTEKIAANKSALVVFVCSVPLTIVLGLKLFGVF